MECIILTRMAGHDHHVCISYTLLPGLVTTVQGCCGADSEHLLG